MATSLGEINKTFAGGSEIDSEPLQDVGENFVISFLVIADNINDTIQQIEEATSITNPTLNIPAYRTQRGNSYLVRKHCRELNSGSRTWQVDCYYEEHVDITTVAIARGPKSYGVYTWGAESITEVISRDAITGIRVANAVGEPFILEAPIPIPVLTYTKILPTLPANFILKYLNKVNSVEFLGFPAKTALMADIQDVPFEHSGGLQRKVTFVLKFNLRKTKDEQGEESVLGWQVELQNRGTKYYETSQSSGAPLRTEVKFRDKFKDVTDGDLEFDGSKRASGLVPLYLRFNIFALENFNSLGIDL